MTLFIERRAAIRIESADSVDVGAKLKKLSARRKKPSDTFATRIGAMTGPAAGRGAPPLN